MGRVADNFSELYNPWFYPNCQPLKEILRQRRLVNAMPRPSSPSARTPRISSRIYLPLRLSFFFPLKLRCVLIAAPAERGVLFMENT